MERMWSPWRSAYIKGESEPTDGSCFLCACANAPEFTAENLLVYRTDDTMVVMNRYPYNSGHLLVAPREHIGDLASLDPTAAHHLIEAVQYSVQVCQSVLKPHSFNVGANLGSDAGAGVPDHLHFHIVPRWRGDTNFMPVLHEVKIISEVLEQLWEQVRAEFAQQKQ